MRTERSAGCSSTPSLRSRDQPLGRVGREAVNLTTEAGESYQAWPDWNAPYSRIWIDARGEGAVYSPDGMRIQFDDGRVWQRDIGPPPPVVFRRAPVVYSR